MKSLFRWPALVLVAFALCLCVAPAHAAEPDADPGSVDDTVTVESEADDKNITVNITMPVVPPPTDPADNSAPAEAPEEPAPEAEPDYTPYAAFSLDSLTRADDPEALSVIIDSLFGAYTPRTQTVTEYLSDGTSVTYQQYVPGVAGMDWSWLAGVGLFGLCLLSFFKIVGGVLKRG